MPAPRVFSAPSKQGSAAVAWPCWSAPTVSAKKILISGGGRCNFTNIHCTPDNFPSSDPHFAKSALARFTPADFIAVVEKHRIPYHEKTLGRLFCDRSATDITNLLESESRAASVQVFLSCNIREVQRSTEFMVR